jgi:hypothetical protein
MNFKKSDYKFTYASSPLSFATPCLKDKILLNINTFDIENMDIEYGDDGELSMIYSKTKSTHAYL